MRHSSYIELSRSALHKNIKFLREYIGPGVEYSAVIKGNAYGHGIRQFVPLAEQCGVRRFSVFSSDEALLASASTEAESDICIMGAIDNGDIEWAVENDISFWIFEIDRLQAAIKASKKVGKPARIHLELETGLNRTGLQDGQLSEAVEIIKVNADRLKIEGVCTHYAGAESESNYLRIQKQIEAFKLQCDSLRGQLPALGRRHSACSAAALIYPETRQDMVRIGIAQYGFWPSGETRMHFVLENVGNGKKQFHDPLKRVMTWKSRVMNIKEVGAGQFVGYGTSYMTTEKQKIAAIPIGYHHGFARSLSNLGHVLIRGRRALVVGLVNMHLIMVDVTRLPDLQKGEEVVLIGKQKKAEITVGSFSDLTRFQNYEVLARLPYNIPRIIVD
jgi:alanine racemase